MSSGSPWSTEKAGGKVWERVRLGGRRRNKLEAGSHEWWRNIGITCTHLGLLCWIRRRAGFVTLALHAHLLPTGYKWKRAALFNIVINLHHFHHWCCHLFLDEGSLHLVAELWVPRRAGDTAHLAHRPENVHRQGCQNCDESDNHDERYDFPHIKRKILYENLKSERKLWRWRFGWSVTVERVRGIFHLVRSAQ